MEPTSEERILAGFSHLMIIFGWYGTAAAVTIWIVKREKSEFIKYSIKQAVAYQIIVLGIMYGMRYLKAPAVIKAIFTYNVMFSPDVFGIIFVMIGLGLFLYGAAGAVANFKGKKFKYVLIGNLIEKHF